MITLKSFTLKSRVIQSPMAGCTDLAFRLLARKRGMEFAFLEMISADALVRDNRKTFTKMKTVAEDKPLGAQLVGCNPDTMGAAAEMLEGMGYDWIDLNLGCPVPKIVSPGGGSALLIEPEKSKKIFERVVRSIKKVPVTVKMRKGFQDDTGEEAVRISKIAEDAGMDAVSVHGRTRVQGYSGHADWKAIGKVKRAVRIPVFGNGDVKTGGQAKEMLSISGCDGVMIGRGALGNPWVYKSIEAVLNQEQEPERPTFEEIKKTALEHFELELKTEGTKTGLLKSRRVICWYFVGCPSVAEFRNAINRSQDADQVRDLIRAYEPYN